MSASNYEVRSGGQPDSRTWYLPATDVAVRHVMRGLVGTPVRGSTYRALQRLGGGWLQRQHLAALAWWRWRNGSECPLGVALDLQAGWYMAVGDTELQRRELAAILQSLSASGARPVAFKGAALAYTVYPDPACRVMGDLDLWIVAEDMPRAQAALEAIGYRFEAKADRPPALMALFSGEVRMYGPDKASGLVELHLGVFAGEWLRRVACVDEAAISARCQPVELTGCRAYALAAEDHLLQISVHAAVNHQLSMSAMRALIDVALLARHQPLDWSAVVRRAKAWRVATATWLVLSLAIDLCGLDEAAEAARQLAPSKVRQRLIGRFANAEALIELRDLSQSKWRYVYLLLMVDRKRDAVRLALRTLWPEDEWLQARYGQGGWRARLRHLLGAARGRI